MNKSKKSFLAAITSLILTGLSGIAGLVVTRIIIESYGSDLNGLNSTVTQFINMMLIVEGGFTLASTVALFGPLTVNDNYRINGILSATRIKFNRIGITFLLISVPVSIIYSFIIKTEIDTLTVIAFFLLLVFSTAFNLTYASKYKILLQTDQSEYILNTISIINLIVTQALVYILALNRAHMLSLRFVIFVGSITTQIVIAWVSKKIYKQASFDSVPLHAEIRGTKDVFIQKLNNVFYSTFPILFISSTSGTIYASVYFVYNSVMTIIKSVIYSIINAPLMSIGKLISEGNKEHTFKIFLQYEFVVNYMMLTLLSVTSVLIIPFVKVYSSGISDVGYINRWVASLMILTAYFEMVHIPSGNIINMSGLFQISRKFQIRASIVLCICVSIGQLVAGLNGILAGVMLTSITLSIQEIVYVYKYYFGNKLVYYLHNVVPLVVAGIIIITCELLVVPSITNYFQFFVVGSILFVINASVLIGVSYLTNKNMTIDIVRRVRSIIVEKL